MTDKNRVRLNDNNGQCVGLLTKEDEGWWARRRIDTRWQPAKGPYPSKQAAAGSIGLKLTTKKAIRAEDSRN